MLRNLISSEEQKIKNAELDKAKDNDSNFFIRFSDLSNKAKYRFVKSMKKHSSCDSIRNRVEDVDILSVLEAADPVVLHGYNFHSWQWPRWKEIQFSRLVYLMCCRRPSSNVHDRIRDTVKDVCR